MKPATLQLPTPQRPLAAEDGMDEHAEPPKAPAPSAVPPRERFVMCAPRYLSTAIKNNVFMSGAKIDVPRAMREWRRIKNVITAFDVEVLEIPPVQGLQDQVFVANVAIAIEPFIVLAHYKAAGRPGEEAPARAFFERLGYDVIRPPHHFEGEADLKKLNAKTYFGGIGQFSDPKAFAWIEEETGVQIVQVKEVNPKQYHLDCSLFVINPENVLVTTLGLDKAALKTIELYANIIETPKGIETTGITNGVKIPGKKIYLSGTFNPEDAQYRKAMEWLNETMDKFGYTCVILDTDEFDASGADLSCCLMNLDF